MLVDGDTLARNSAANDTTLFCEALAKATKQPEQFDIHGGVVANKYADAAILARTHSTHALYHEISAQNFHARDRVRAGAYPPTPLANSSPAPIATPRVKHL